MPRIVSHVIMIAAAAAIAGGTADAQRKRPVHAPTPVGAVAADGCVTRFTANDWATMLNDVRTSKPEIAERLKTDPEFRTLQVANLRELFAMGCQAVKDGIANDPTNRAELANIRAQISATEYERSAVKPPPASPLSSVSDARVAQFYQTAGNEARFNDFLKVKLDILNRAMPEQAGGKITDEERAQARTLFARMSLLAADSALPAARANTMLRSRIALQAKLQQAQFLGAALSDSLANKFQATDADISKFIAEHPELDTSAVKTKAEGILKRALAGEDFAKLANEYSQDPGNMSEDGKPQGGLYADVKKGTMVPEFESAALAVEAGTVSPVLAKSDYGYHVIKLERKGDRNGTFTYDVRHILLMTQFQDPENPNSAPVSAAEIARRTIERQRADAVREKIVKDNPVEMAEMPTGDAAPVKKPTPARRPVRK